jgi:voltage-gated potassium channel
MAPAAAAAALSSRETSIVATYPADLAREALGLVEREAMDERAREIERRLEWPLLVAALLTIPAIAIEQSNVGEPWDTVAVALNWTIWTAFLLELVVMVHVTPKPGQWLRNHPLDVAIVVLTPPFLPASLQAARAFRLLRLVRLLRAAGLARRLLSTEGVRDAAVLALLTVLGGGASYAAVEKSQNLSAWDGVWWAMTTVTTVGYGDSYPKTDAGRVIALVVMLVGIGFVAILTAAAAERFMASREQIADERREIRERLDEIARRLDALDSGR